MRTENKQNDPAVEYARTKVQQIRKRLGHYPSSRVSSKASSRVSSRQKKDGKEHQTLKQQPYYQKQTIIRKPVLTQSAQKNDYQNRIQNINDINMKIKKILGTQEIKKQQLFIQKSGRSQKYKQGYKQLQQNKFHSKEQQKKSGQSKQFTRKLSQLGYNGYSVSIQLGTNQFKQREAKLAVGRDPIKREFQKDNSNRKFIKQKPEQDTNMLLPKSRQEHLLQYKSKHVLDKQITADKQTIPSKQMMPNSKQVVPSGQQMNRKESRQSRVNVNQRSQVSSVKAIMNQGNATMNQGSEDYGRTQTIGLAELLGEQVKMEQRLRQCKWQFSEWQDSQKWDKLLLQAKHYIPNIDNTDHLKAIFEISSEQHNPFFQTSASIDHVCIPNLLNSYQTAKIFWLQRVSECVSIQKLQAQCFSIADIDSSNKGYIGVQDMVCFINLYTGNFFRNRDIISVHKRFVSLQQYKKQLMYETFLDKVTKK